MFYKNEKGENKIYCEDCVSNMALGGYTFKHIEDPRLWVYKDTMIKIYGKEFRKQFTS